MEVHFSTVTSSVPDYAAFAYADDNNGLVGDLIARVERRPCGWFRVSWVNPDGSEIQYQPLFTSSADALSYIDRNCKSFFDAFWSEELTRRSVPIPA
jgi:hypothetical protein